MRQSAALARALGVRLHTHLAETLDEEQFCLEQFGHRPVAYMETLDWVGDDVWFAHSVHVNQAEIGVYARTGCGVAHCPSSNMRLASGIAPVSRYRAAGVKVGLGVDGSASNDGSHLLGEARQALLLARVLGDPGALTARQALELATLGGAAVLGRDDIGALAPGKCADFFTLDINRLAYAGALHDPVAAVLFCAPQTVDFTVVHGRVIVSQGRLATVDAGPLVERHNRLARQLVTA
jgi:cytosine/adenosine deaminase-related metal-dependent hydrolase